MESNKSTNKESRLKLYLKSISSAYFLLFVNIIYSFISIPIVLHFLGKQTFGLWALTMQIGAVLQLADAGIGGALARILIDYKDDKKSPAYRQTLYSVWLVIVLIGISLFILAWVGTEPIIKLLGIDLLEHPEYPVFLLVYCLVFSFGFTLRPINLVLSAHQRNDLVNWTSTLGLVTGFIVLITCLNLKMGLWSLLYSQSSVMALSASINFFQARRLHYIPLPRIHDFFNWARLGEVASYGWQRLLAIIGGTLLTSAPTFLITRYLGLEATATWAIGTRVQQLMMQVTARLPELAFPSLVEMHVRGESDLLKRRFMEVLTITGGLGCALSGILLVCNHDFIQLWTSSNMSWGVEINIAISLFLPVIVFQKTLWYPASIAKNLGISRYVLLLEALLFFLIVSSYPRENLSLSVIAWSLFSSCILMSLPAFTWRTSTILNFSFGKIISQLLKIVLTVLAPVLIFAYLITLSNLPTSWLYLAGKSAAMMIIGTLCLLLLPEIRKTLVMVLQKLKLKE